MAGSRDELARLRAWWLRRQGLSPATAPKTVLDCLRQAGWFPTSGSTGLYLSIRARLPGISRESVDRPAIDGIDVVEVPGGHGRPSAVVPRDEMALALRLHAASYDKHLAPLFASGALSAAALEAVAAQVCQALDESPLSTAELRATVTHADAGSLLTVALNQLALRGVVRRFPIDGRFDSTKYMYELRHPDDRPDLAAEGGAAAVVLKATRHFLRCHGPATVDEVAWWTLAAKGDVRKALAALGADAIAVTGWAREAWLLPEDVRAWKTFRGGSGDRVILLPYRDPFVYARRPPAVLAARDTVPVLNDKLNPVGIGAIDGLAHHAIVADGQVVGVWEYDPESEEVVTRVWSGNKALGRRVATAAAETGRFIRQQLEDAKLSAVDPPARRARRIAFCRA